MVKLSSIFFFFFFFFTLVTCITEVSAALPSCPVNLTYIETYPWESTPCHKDPYSVRCCNSFSSIFMTGFAQYLEESSTFFLPNESYVSSCLSALQGKLSATSIEPSVVIPLCLKNHSRFVANNSGCPGIVTLEDWHRKVGPSSTHLLNTSCKGDLTNLTSCDACLRAGIGAVAQMADLGKDVGRCLLLVVLYVAGIVSEYGPLDSRTMSCTAGVLAEESFDLDAEQTPKGLSKGRVLQLVFGIVGGLILVIGISVFLYRRRKKIGKKGLDSEPVSSLDQSDLMLDKMGLQWFRLHDLERATDGFSSKNMVGEGAFGVVYRGKLEGDDGCLVAVKELLEVECFGNEEEFVNEVEIVSKIRHRNLLHLRGCCVAGGGDMSRRKRRFLVYDFMANGSVADHLSDMSRRIQLCWEQRKNIIIDVAKGLVYLHCGVKPAIYHRDIKASNILLDMDLKAKVADFGLARQGKDENSHVTTRVAGTRGFLAPEYAMYGHLTHKSDVYSFGVLILEIVTARKAIDTSSSNSSAVLITEWAWNLVKSGKVDDIFDEAMKNEVECNDSEMRRFVMVAIHCAHIVAARRPTITEALRMLEGDMKLPKLPNRPPRMSHESLSLGVVHGSSQD
ncbi:Probable receptor-like protein kinase At1g11050 [Linum grandiflorum]